MSLVPLRVMVSRFWRAKSAPGKDAGSARIGNTGATEDAAWRCFAAARSALTIARRGTAASLDCSRGMETWKLPEIPTPGGSRSPVVLLSEDEARAVLVGLDAGQELGDHQVKEHAWLLVVEGSVLIRTGGDEFDAPAGTLAHFEPDERRSVSSIRGAKLLLLLAPWPGPGHYRGSESAGERAKPL
jgi:quercetin dioxygenase-like cupin family protein